MAGYETLPSGKVRAVVRTPAAGKVQRTFDSELEARAWAAPLELRKGRADVVRSARRHRLTLAEYYLEWYVPLRRGASGTLAKQDSYWRNHVEPAFGRWQLQRITTRALDAWVTGLDEAGEISASTIRGVVYLLSNILRRAMKDQLVDGNPVASMEPLPEVTPAEFRVVDADEIARVVKVLDDWHEQPTRKHGKRTEADPRRTYGTLYLLAWQTGLRWAELAGLPVRAVDLERRVLRVLKRRNRDGREHDATKNGRVRTVPITDAMVERLAVLIAGRTATDHVFVNPRSGEPLDYRRTYGRVWRPAIDAAGLDPAQLRPRQHDLRHSAGTTMLEAGVRLDQVRDILGHGDTRMTERYAHRLSDGFEAARAAFDR